MRRQANDTQEEREKDRQIQRRRKRQRQKQTRREREKETEATSALYLPGERMWHWERAHQRTRLDYCRRRAEPRTTTGSYQC